MMNMHVKWVLCVNGVARLVVLPQAISAGALDKSFESEKVSSLQLNPHSDICRG